MLQIHVTYEGTMHGRLAITLACINRIQYVMIKQYGNMGKKD